MRSLNDIHYYHAHVYFEQQEVDRATLLCESATKLFPDIKMGRVHTRPVGPHPLPSCQLSIHNKDIGDVIGWLALNRSNCPVFIHPSTGDDYADHTDHTIWLGEQSPLNLGVFSASH